MWPTRRSPEVSIGAVNSGRRLPSPLMANSTEPDETELLRRYRAGDAVAFERLYDAHERPCFDFIRRQLAAADEATAEDLHQEVWLAVARHGASFDAGKSRFVTWLFTIARNKVMDHFRRSAGVVHLVDDIGDDALAELPDEADFQPDQVADQRQLAAAIVREVQALPFLQRETFVLFAHHELSLAEVAQITQVGIETTKSRLRYARTSLRQALAPWKARHA
jgi:RNA polymerase sigma-70 factor (ECF subfamily)